MRPQFYPNGTWIDIETLCNPGVSSHRRKFQPRARSAISFVSSVPALRFSHALKMSKGEPCICGVPENFIKFAILAGCRDKSRHGHLRDIKERQYTSGYSCGHFGKAIRWVCCQYLGSMVEWSCCSSFGPQLSRGWACPRSKGFGLIHFHRLSSFRVPSIILGLFFNDLVVQLLPFLSVSVTLCGLLGKN